MKSVLHPPAVEANAAAEAPKHQDSIRDMMQDITNRITMQLSEHNEALNVQVKAIMAWSKKLDSVEKQLANAANEISSLRGMSFSALGSLNTTLRGLTIEEVTACITEQLGKMQQTDVLRPILESIASSNKTSAERLENRLSSLEQSLSVASSVAVVRAQVIAASTAIRDLSTSTDMLLAATEKVEKQNAPVNGAD